MGDQLPAKGPGGADGLFSQPEQLVSSTSAKPNILIVDQFGDLLQLDGLQD